METGEGTLNRPHLSTRESGDEPIPDDLFDLSLSLCPISQWLEENTVKRLRSSPPADMDRISNLSDDILDLIIKSLELKERARTSILARQWRNVWTISPISIDGNFLEPDNFDATRFVSKREKFQYLNSWRLRAVESIVSSHPGPICSFWLSCTGLHSERLQRVVELLVQKGIRDFYVNISPENGDLSKVDISANLLSCRSLRSLGFLRCNNFFKTFKLTSTCFPNLTNLFLNDLGVRSEFFEELWRHCPSLENLDIDTYRVDRDDKHIHIRSPNLRSFTLRTHEKCLDVLDIVIDDAPKLTRLNFAKSVLIYSKVRIVNAPMLETLGYVTMQFHKFLFGEKIPKNVKESDKLGYTVKKLAIYADFERPGEIEKFIEILYRFPCVKHLEAKIKLLDEDCPELNEIWDEQRGLAIPCLQSSLETVKIHHYKALIHDDLGFANFLLTESLVLKELSFVSANPWGGKKREKEISFMRDNLFLDEQASPAARVFFTVDKRFSGRLPSWTKRI